MRVSVSYDDSDVAKALSKIIKDDKKDEFVKLLTPMICQSSPASTYFFKIMLGNDLPKVIPNGTLCKLSINELGYNANKPNIKKKYADEHGNVVVTVKEFTGYHEYSNYQVYYTNVDDNGNDTKDYCIVQGVLLSIIEEI